MKEYLEATYMLDYDNRKIKKLVDERKWREKEDFQKIQEIYNYVRDEINFGYNVDDAIMASEVLKDGYGQCNTKGTLLMALLRAVQIPCRMHGFTIDKRLQKGAMTGIVYQFAPQNIVHSWVEILFEGEWYHLEGFILDTLYLNQLQKRFSDCQGSFCGYGVATSDFKNPQIDWNRNNTYIQKEGINQDFGLFNSPDEFFAQHNQELIPVKKWIYQKVGRQLMNRNVERIRKRKNIRVGWL